MNIYEIEVMACGSYCVVNLNDRSGCSDIEKDCWQEAWFRVAAESVQSALRLVYNEYEKLNKDYTNSCDSLYYDPKSVKMEEYDWDDEGEEVLDYHFKEPVDGAKIPRRYSEEA